MSSKIILLGLACASTALAQSYSLNADFSGSTFFDNFNFYTGADPTDGFVQYVDYNTAVANGLIGNPSVAAWGVDHTTVLNPNGGVGRQSVRLTSKDTWTHGLFILDVEHMPGSTCGLWPAYWTLGQEGTWPYSGEIDIIEGANTGTTDLTSLHTSDGCTVAGSGQTGILETNNCAVSYSSTGCGTSNPNTQSYGSGLNSIGGGVYAMEWTSASIQVWFFPRGDIPASINNGDPNPSSDFGEPVAVFAGSCDIDSHFFDHAIVFDTTFCGDWAGATFTSQGCPVEGGQSSSASCVTYVAENPSVFTDSYWWVNSLKVYQENSNGPNEDFAAADASSSTSLPANQTSSVIPRASTAQVPYTSIHVAMGVSHTTSSVPTGASLTNPNTASPPPQTTIAAA